MIIGTIVLGCVVVGVGVLLYFAGPTVMLTHRLDVYAAKERQTWARVGAAFERLGSSLQQVGISAEQTTEAFKRFSEAFPRVEEQR